MSVSKRLRYEIFRRDNHSCRYCGAHAPDVSMTIDHVVPRALGGGDEPGNLVTSCEPCNSGKTSVAVDQATIDDVTADALRWAAAMKRAAEVQAEMGTEQDDLIEWFDYTWQCWTSNEQYIPRPTSWKSSVKIFLDSNLSEDEIEEAVLIAMGNERISPDMTWRYFCGICWRKLDQRREIAAALIQAEDAQDAR